MTLAPSIGERLSLARNAVENIPGSEVMWRLGANKLNLRDPSSRSR